MPKDEIGHPASSTDAPPSLTSGEIEAAQRIADYYSYCEEADEFVEDAITVARALLSSLKGSAGKGNTSAAGAAPLDKGQPAPAALEDCAHAYVAFGADGWRCMKCRKPMRLIPSQEGASEGEGQT